MWNIAQAELARLLRAVWPGWWLVWVAIAWAAALQEPPALRGLGFDLTNPALASGFAVSWVVVLCLGSLAPSPATQSATFRGQAAHPQVIGAEWLAISLYGLAATAMLGICTTPVAAPWSQPFGLSTLHGVTLAAAGPLIRRVAVPDPMRPLLAIAVAVAYLALLAVAPVGPSTAAADPDTTALAWTHIVPAPCFLIAAWIGAHGCRRTPGKTP